MTKQTMQFLFGDRELLLNISDLLSAPTEVIVNPANSGLSHGEGLAEQILQWTFGFHSCLDYFG